MFKAESRWHLALAGAAGLLACSLAFGQVPAKKTPAKSAAEAPGASAARFKGIWEPAHVGEDIKLNSVYFVSAEVGWVAGDKGSIFHTRDGGKTWKAQLGGDPGSSADPVKDLQFLDEKTGWAVFGDGKLLRTTDGETWEEYGKVGEHYGYYLDYLFLSPSEAVQIVKEGNILMRTQDGGKKWRQVYPPCKVKVEAGGLPQTLSCRLTSLFFTSAENGFAAGSTIRPAVFFLLKTTDGGNSWSLLTTVPDVAHTDEAYFAQYIHFTDANNGLAVLPRGEKVLITSDGGLTWRGIISQVKGPMRFADAQNAMSFNYGYDANRPSISYTTNGGKSWITRQMVLPGVPRALSVPRSDRAYLAGDHGMVFRYRVIPETAPNPPNSFVAPAMQRSQQP